MKIGVLSDTHGSFFYVEKAFDVLSDCDYIIHGGDILYHGPRNPLPKGYDPKSVANKINDLDNLFFTRGNCDSDVDQMVLNHPIQSPYVFLSIEGKKIFLCHGYKKPLNELITQAKNLNCDMFIYGHTHIKELRRDQDLIVLNPGSTSLPKDNSHSVAIIDEKHISLIDINTKTVIQVLEY
ncbi:phosphodiesterase [Peptostreptococcaceae bacterium AGR-M142]